MTIYRAEVKDLEVVAELFNLYRIFQKQESDLQGASEFIEVRLQNEESVVFVANEGDEPAGFAQLYPLFSSVSMKRIWVLNDLYIKKEFRRKGFGEKLLKACIQFGEETKAGGILLETCDDNYGAQDLYEKNGFKKEENYFYFYRI